SRSGTRPTASSSASTAAGAAATRCTGRRGSGPFDAPATEAAPRAATAGPRPPTPPAPPPAARGEPRPGAAPAPPPAPRRRPARHTGHPLLPGVLGGAAEGRVAEPAAGDQRHGGRPHRLPHHRRLPLCERPALELVRRARAAAIGSREETQCSAGT